jgi:hypothetical protein
MLPDKNVVRSTLVGLDLNLELINIVMLFTLLDQHRQPVSRR